MKNWFTDAQQGDTRIDEVLRVARFAASARSALTAVLVSCAGDVVTAVIIAVAEPTPNLRYLRLGGAVAAAILTAVALIVLFLQIVAKKLRGTANRHSEYNGVERKPRIKRYWARVRSWETLTPYLTASFVGSVTAILAAVGA